MTQLTQNKLIFYLQSLAYLCLSFNKQIAYKPLFFQFPRPSSSLTKSVTTTTMRRLKPQLLPCWFKSTAGSAKPVKD